MSSSSDEAPEETTFNESKLQARLRAKNEQSSKSEQVRAQKQKRKLAEEKYKLQQLEAKEKKQLKAKKLLSEILAEADNSEDEESGLDSENEVNGATIKKMSKLQANLVKNKKTFKEEGRFKVQVAEPGKVSKKKRLPPASKAVTKRESILARTQLRR